ncbi:hypothetical protein RV12_GL002608 [Enterococcus quebecensis]|nr:hypothetical protein RV12_GL002608 [Enterococcus quebecensis]
MAKNLNYHKTSNILFISTPSVYQQIKKLEEHLHLKLFKKEGRHIFLTNAGEQLIPIAQKLIFTYEESLEQVNAIRNHHQSTLKIVTSHFVAVYIMPKFLTFFFREAPDIEISVDYIEDELMENMIEIGKFDVALTRIKPNHNKLKCTSVYSCPIKLVVPNNDTSKNELSYLKEYQVLTGNHPTYWEKLEQDIFKANPEVKFFSVDNVKMVESLISRKQGISYLPMCIFHESMSKELNVIKPKLIVPPDFTIYSIWSKNNAEVVRFNGLVDKFFETYF